MMITQQALHVAGVVRSPQLQYELSEAIADCDGTELDLRIGGLRSLAPDLLRGERTPSVLLLDVDVNDVEDMAVLEQLSAEASRAHVPIVATAGDLGPATVRRLLRDGVADLIPQPVDRAEVMDVLRSADHKARRRQQHDPSQCRILTFSRATGGAGATTLAVNVAHALARPHRRAQAKVCLIDLDLQFGTVALQLDLHPTTGLFDMAQARRSFDPSLFARSLVEHRSGLRVLTSPNSPISLEALRPAVVNALLELARVEFDYVVIDLPIALTSWTETVLSHSDLVYLVTQPSLPAVWQLRRLLEFVGEFGLEDLNVQLALNRLQDSFWSAGSQRRQAEKALGRRFDYCIADQFEVLNDAANRGAPVLDVRRYSRFGRQLRNMIEHSLRDLAARPALTGAAAH
jgi:pilus assembly protein CpaE